LAWLGTIGQEDERGSEGAEAGHGFVFNINVRIGLKFSPKSHTFEQKKILRGGLTKEQFNNFRELYL
jgi:hypothetical protein